ncbi:MAG TPA: alpha/beta hydrolase [Ktedonobacterales bacterium]|nr:alpha/beta hydrolase [Ktedonobacterales bacterium]
MAESIVATPHDIEVNGLQLRYVTWGERSSARDSVILVHGLTSSLKAWVEIGPALAARGWHVIALDLRGRGLSDKPPHGYGIPYHANDLLSLADALGLERIHVVGHSLGAQITLFLAAQHPTRVGRIALIDAGGRLPDDALAAIAVSLKRLGTVYPSVDALLDTQRLSPVYQWNAMWDEYYRYDAEEQPGGGVKSRVRREVVEEELSVNAMTRLEAAPEHITAPTLILRATLGTVAPDRGFILAADEAERMHRVIAGSRYLEVPNTNHYTILLSNLLLREITAFLDGAVPERVELIQEG